MNKMKDMLQIKSVRGNRIETQGVVVTPLSKAIVVNLPMGGFVWNRPVGIEVEKDQQIKRIPIIDVTLIAQLGIIAFGMFLTIAFWLIGRKKLGNIKKGV
jgi:hypothetical protein